ncbi:hypothetical protein SAMN05428949_1864 [Chitinophaga sp. YR627]|uniref:hypothetical protein n=1 Tax=Chitinophaga sp. YR627 TaxID=1881041 RepID=UPI0008F2333E|nr:hypothetical protein [Chitinophaga sp. YR627]SFN19489.1 hypothetical protein SAMN05428949_1864 [Chitinophaga sp. YR627]
MKFFVSPNDIILEFWIRKQYEQAPYQEVRGFFFTPEEAAVNMDAANLFDHYLTLAQRDGFLTYSSHEYTNPDGTPMKIYSLTAYGRELGQRLVQAGTL